MGYSKIVGVDKAERARKGRLYQHVGGKRVKKFAYSPYTAKAGETYTFYADIVVRTSKVSPSAGVKPQPLGVPEMVERNITTSIVQGTFLEFRDAVASGEIAEKLELVTAKYEGEVLAVSFWRNRETNVDTGASD